jgi:Clp amino terminal domain, pathogenicity island component
MFERYTEQARRIIFFARYEANQYGSPHIEPEHLVLALCRERPPVARQFFGSGDSLRAFREEVESQGEIGPRRLESAEVPLSAASKRVLMCAAEEADRLSHKHIGTEHILLGILREKKGLASRFLRAGGLELSALRTELAGQRGGGQSSEELPGLEDSAGFSVGIPEWQEQGIPDGYGFAQLLFNPPTGILIAEMCHGTAALFLPNRLFWRHKDGEGYKPLGTPGEDCSQESAVTALNKPLLFFNSSKMVREGRHARGKWDGLYSVDLEDHEHRALCVERDIAAARALRRLLGY